MLEIVNIREKTDEIVSALDKRNQSYADDIAKVLSIDAKRRQIQVELDSQLASLNRLSKRIGELFKAGKTDEANAAKEETTTLKNQSQALRDELNGLEVDQKNLLYNIPNVPHNSVPLGNSDQDNVIMSNHGVMPSLTSKLAHWELAEKYQLIDFELGVKVTGAGFPIYRGKGAKLQRALINFFLQEADKAGYEEFIPPLVVNEASGYGTGQLPDKEGQMYHVGSEGLYLIPTAEVPLTNVYRDVIVNEGDFPIKLCGYTPCFRREAGSYGKDVRGLNRLHQFDKVEIVQVEHPEKSYQTLDNMVKHVEGLLEKLELPYRVARLCGGDLGAAAALTFDLEVYSAAQEKWLEVSSVSNFETYQANRLKLRYRDGNGKNKLVHTLNGSALALPRILAALLENNQTATGIKIPAALIPYTGFSEIN